MKIKDLIIKLLFIALFSQLWISPCLPQEPEKSKPYIAGTWIGTLEIQTIELRLVVRLFLDENENLTGLMDSPDQGAKDIEISSAEYKHDSLIFSVDVIKGKYIGMINYKDTTINGIWIQAGMELPLVLKKVNKAPELNRPQEPKPPFPYKEEEIVIKNKKAGLELAGTLTYPDTEGEFPAIILVSGSGPQDRNEEIMGHKPFLVIADHLTNCGYAVFRYDDRGVGKSTGSFLNATTVDFAGDVEAIFEFLKKHKRINPKLIGIIGHSEGGLIAPMIAANNPDVAFIVLLAGPGLTGEVILTQQTKLILEAMEVEEKSIKKTLDQNQAIYNILKKYKNNKKVEKKINKLLLKTEKDNPQKIEGMIKTVTSPWFRYFLFYDPKPTLKKVQCPVLALNGEKDLQVPSKENLEAIRQALMAGENKNFTIKELKGLNHLFQTAETGAPNEYSKIEETFCPAVLKIIETWIMFRLEDRKK